MRSKLLIALLLIGTLCVELSVAGPIGGKPDVESPSAVLTPYNATEGGAVVPGGVSETVNTSSDELDVEKTQDSSSETSDESVTDAPIDSTTEDSWVDAVTWIDYTDSSVEDTTPVPITSSSEESSTEDTTSETLSEGTSSETSSEDTTSAPIISSSESSSEGTSEETSSEEKTDLKNRVELLEDFILHLDTLVRHVQNQTDRQDKRLNELSDNVQQAVSKSAKDGEELANKVYKLANMMDYAASKLVQKMDFQLNKQDNRINKLSSDIQRVLSVLETTAKDSSNKDQKLAKEVNELTDKVHQLQRLTDYINDDVVQYIYSKLAQQNERFTDIENEQSSHVEALETFDKLLFKISKILEVLPVFMEKIQKLENAPVVHYHYGDY